MQLKLYEEIAQLVLAIHNCQTSGNVQWETRHTEKLKDLMEELPSGSGFDNGTDIDLDKSTGGRIVFTTAFHHMDENGYYTTWTDHTVVMTPAFLGGFALRVTGRNRNDIKDYIAESFYSALSTLLPDPAQPVAAQRIPTDADHAAYDREFGENDSNGQA